jgi:hypothetical protein
VGSSEGAEVDAAQTNSSVGYRVDGRETPARARVTGPAPAGGGGGIGGVPVDVASPEAPLEGDEEDSEAAPPEAPLEGDEEAAPEAGLEGEAGPPEAELEGDEEAPEPEGVAAQGPGTSAGAGGRRDGGSPAGEGGGGGRHLFLCKRKAVLIKVNVPRGEHPVRHRIIETVAFGVSRVTQEDARDGTGGEFMWGGGDGTRIATTSEDA